MFYAMNRFKVARGAESTFEEIWRSRESHLDAVSGFVEFKMLRGPETDAYSLYVSHSVWESRDAFAGWTKSEAFRAAHKNAGDHKAVYLEPPSFEGFEPVEGI